jgi:hypothetical protein
MTAPPASASLDQERLARFVAAVATAGDTPALIQLVAGDTGYLQFCRWALGRAGSAPVGFAGRLEAVCRQAGMDSGRLHARLRPVARVLRLTEEDGGRPDHYAVLGLAPAADAAAVKRAYRRKARSLHPDTGGTADSRAFAELQAAYHTLGDAGRRRAYDREAPAADGWREAARRRPDEAPRRWPFLTGLGLTLALLVAAAFLLDAYEREAALRSGHPGRPVVTAHAARPDPPPPPAPALSRAALAPEQEPEGPAPKASAGHSAPLETALADAPPPPASGEAQAAAPRLAVYVAGPRGAEAARRLAQALTAAGYARPVVRPVSYAGGSTVRYFHAADGRLARAVRPLVEQALAREEAPGDVVALKNLGRRYPKAPAGRVEIWLNPPEPPPPQALRPEGLEAAAAPAVQNRDRGVRLRDFLEDYCRAYTAKDLEAFAAFFLPEALENGQPFQGLLPRYRQNLARMDSLDYRIELERYALNADAGSLSLEGIFLARCRLVGEEVRENRGRIAMELVEAGEGFRVRRLEYRSEAPGNDRTQD